MNKGREKQLRSEAAATGGVLLAIILFWIVAGFGAAELDITVWQMPLWVITGCIGTWVLAMGLVYWLIAKIFVDMDLTDLEEETPHE